MNDKFKAAERYAKVIPKMKPSSKRTGVRRLLSKIKDAIQNG